jgi:formylglycine-generating enzyme
VSGATIARGAQKGVTATVSDVRLDKYEVTVGRFRKFVEAWSKGWRPAAGSGKHAHLNGGRGLADLSGGSELGWSDAQSRYVGAPGASAAVPTASGASNANDWNKALACSKQATWTAAAGSGDDRAQNCLSWFDAAAFCIWDGGFLPSEGEWELAATGGAARRTFPWGDDAPDATRANYNGASVSAVGKLAAGDGFFGQSDLAGNVWEWTLDGFGPLDLSTKNAAKLTGSNDRMLRGGAFVNDAGFLASTVRVSSYAAVRSDTAGVRCARLP